MHLLCTLNGAPVGFPADAVREVVPLPLIVSLPLPTRAGAPLVLGAVNLRGRLKPVFDLCSSLELPFCPLSPRDNLVVLKFEGRVLCVRVSLVHDVQTLLSRQEVSSGILDGIARAGDQIVRLVRLSALFEAFDTSPALAPGAAPALAGAGTGNEGGAPLDLWSALSPEELEILELRAASLAKPLETSASGLATVEDNARLWAVVRWGGELFGLDLEWVREFAPLRALAPIPLSPPHILGLMNLRGDILPVLDLREVTGVVPDKVSHAPQGAAETTLGEKVAPNFRLPASSASGGPISRPDLPLQNSEVAPGKIAPGEAAPGETIAMQIVVVEHAGTRFGVWVDEVVDIFAAARSQIQNAPLSLREETELLQGSVSFAGRRLGLLDLEKAFERLGALEARV